MKGVRESGAGSKILMECLGSLELLFHMRSAVGDYGECFIFFILPFLASIPAVKLETKLAVYIKDKVIHHSSLLRTITIFTLKFLGKLRQLVTFTEIQMSSIFA